jgi:hypothetical protein
MRGDIISVQSQLRGVGDAFDALSQVLVDELDYVRGDFAKTKACAAPHPSALNPRPETLELMSDDLLH